MKLFSIIFSIYFLISISGNVFPKDKRKFWYEKKRIAFLVGVNDYETATDLKYAVSDTHKIRQTFIQVGQFEKIITLNDEGLFETNLSKDKKFMNTVLKDKSLKPTQKNILNIYNSILKETPDMLLFYFSGHGFIGEDFKNAIAPSDVKVFSKTENGKKVVAHENELVITTDLANLAKDIEQVVFLIDACRSPLPKKIKKSKSTKNKNIKKENITEKNDSKKEFEPANFDITQDKKLKLFTDYSDTIPLEVENSSGVVILMGAAPNTSSFEDKELESGIFTFFLKKGMETGIQKENPEEFVTISNLKEYIEENFNSYAKEMGKPPQQLYETSNERGRKGDFLVSYGRATDGKEKVEKYSYYNEYEKRKVDTKFIYNKDNDPVDIKFYSIDSKGKRYYPESLNGIYRVKLEHEFGKNGNREFFKSEEFNLKNKSVFTHKMELLEDEIGWEFKSLYVPSEEDKKDFQRSKINYQREIYDFNGNLLLEEFYDDKGDKDKDGNPLKPILIDSVATTKRKWTKSGKLLEEEYLDQGGNPVSKRGYAKYLVEYNSSDQIAKESYLRADGKLIANQNGIFQTIYEYDSEGKLLKKKNVNQKGNLSGDINGVALTNYTYNNACLEKERSIQVNLFKTNIELKVKEQIQKDWIEIGYKICTSEISHFGEKPKEGGKDLAPASDSRNLHKRIRTFDNLGRLVSEDYFRANGRRWFGNGIGRIEFEYFSKLDKNEDVEVEKETLEEVDEISLRKNDQGIFVAESKWLIQKVKHFGEYEIEGKPVPGSDGFGIHSYEYEYNRHCVSVRNSNLNYKVKYTEQLETIQPFRGFDCVSRIWNKDIGGEIIADKTGKSETRIYYTASQQVERFRENFASFAGSVRLLSTENLFEKGKTEVSISIFDPNWNQTLYAIYTIVEGKETLSQKFLYDCNEKGNRTLDAYYTLVDSKETLNEKKFSGYNDKGYQTLYATYKIIEGKETLSEKSVYDYNDKGYQTLYATYKIVNGKEALSEKKVSDYNDALKGSATGKLKSEAIYNIVDDKETLSEKFIYGYNNKGNKALEAKYTLIDGKLILSEKKVYDYNDKGENTVEAKYTLIDGKLILSEKKVSDYNDKGENTVETKYTLIDGKLILSEKKVSDYNDKGNNTVEAKNTVVDGKETLSEKKVSDYNDNGNKTLEAKYKIVDGKETLSVKFVYDYNSKGDQTLNAYYSIVDGKETLGYKSVYDYNDKGNKTLEAYYKLVYGEAVISSKTYFHPNLYPSIFEEESAENKKAEEMQVSAYKNREEAKSKNSASDLAKAIDDDLKSKRDLDELNTWAKEQKDFVNYQTINFNNATKTHDVNYGIIFENPKGTDDKRYIRVTLDRFYRPVGIVFRGGTKTFAEWRKER